MTVLIAIKEEDSVFLGADKQVTGGQIKQDKDTKIFKKELKTINSKGEVIKTETVYFAETGYVVVGNYIRYGFELPYKEEKESYEEYIVTKLCTKLNQSLKESGLIKVKDSKTYSDTNFLIVMNNNIYTISNVGLVCEFEDYVVDGSGYEVALGSLYTSKGKSARERIKLAIEACDKHTIYVNGEYDIIEIKKE